MFKYMQYLDFMVVLNASLKHDNTTLMNEAFRSLCSLLVTSTDIELFDERLLLHTGEMVHL